MKYFILSAGFAPEDEYAWYELREDDSLSPKTPSSWVVFKPLIDYRVSDFSVGILRKNKNLCVVVTKIYSDTRKDFSGRVLYSHFIIESEDDIDNILLQLFVSDLLKDNVSFFAKINNLISATDSPEFPGFKLNGIGLNNLFASTASAISKPWDGKLHFAKNIEPRRKELSEHLRKYKLPDFDGILVVITHNIEPTKLSNISTLVISMSSLYENTAWINKEYKNIMKQDVPDKKAISPFKKKNTKGEYEKSSDGEKVKPSNHSDNDIFTDNLELEEVIPSKVQMIKYLVWKQSGYIKLVGDDEYVYKICKKYLDNHQNESVLYFITRGK